MMDSKTALQEAEAILQKVEIVLQEVENSLQETRAKLRETEKLEERQPNNHRKKERQSKYWNQALSLAWAHITAC